MHPGSIPEQANLALLQAFFDGASRAIVGFALVDSDLRFVAINETLAEINGASVACHQGKTIGEILPDLEAVLLPLYQQVLTTSKPIINIEVSGQVPSQPGMMRHWLVSYVPVQGANHQMYVGGIVVEVTEQKQLILQLEQLNQDLNRSNQDLEQFARTASHDLQEPLRTISSYAQLLERRYGDGVGERGRRYLKHILHSAQRSQQLVRDLLTYARLDAATMKLTAVDMNQLLVDTLELYRVKISQSKAKITQDPLPTVTADRSQLCQVMQNLLGNALKFQPPGGIPEIHVGVERQPDHWQLSVRDNGVGIDAKYNQRIFEVFQRLHLQEEFEGTGIGLSICQKIIQQHHGRIWVESVLGQGSTFYFTLPYPAGEA